MKPTPTFVTQMHRSIAAALTREDRVEIAALALVAADDDPEARAELVIRWFWWYGDAFTADVITRSTEILETEENE